MTDADAAKRLREDMDVRQIADLGTAEALLEYLGVKGKPIAEQRDKVAAFITGAPWARPVYSRYILDLVEMGLID